MSIPVFLVLLGHVVGIFEKKFGVSINEDEVGYIAMHLAVELEG